MRNPAARLNLDLFSGGGIEFVVVSAE